MTFSFALASDAAAFIGLPVLSAWPVEAVHIAAAELADLPWALTSSKHLWTLLDFGMSSRLSRWYFLSIWLHRNPLHDRRLCTYRLYLLRCLLSRRWLAINGSGRPCRACHWNA